MNVSTRPIISNLLFLTKLLMCPQARSPTGTQIQQYPGFIVKPPVASGQWFMGNKKASFSDGIWIKNATFCHSQCKGQACCAKAKLNTDCSNTAFKWEMYLGNALDALGLEVNTGDVPILC